ncbi:hypothetical protein MSBRW_0930 [Methanosarcina barkeri str. Wiesmoor]|uniref:Uncharacterized protein n=2 Tax=Methanosarcina barkeri TaxID=2208 RepID=A0A0E3QHN6_METBA|nr:hypothetical protein MSBRW_0930 [Methanosarcina barkeri str. Wiesmoor]
MPLEGFWWVENLADFNIQDKSGWKWTAMIRQPDFITKDMIKKTIQEVEKKKKLPALSVNIQASCTFLATSIPTFKYTSLSPHNTNL